MCSPTANVGCAICAYASAQLLRQLCCGEATQVGSAHATVACACTCKAVFQLVQDERWSHCTLHDAGSAAAAEASSDGWGEGGL